MNQLKGGGGGGVEYFPTMSHYLLDFAAGFFCCAAS